MINICFGDRIITSRWFSSRKELLLALEKGYSKQILLTEPEGYQQCRLLSVQGGQGGGMLGIGLLQSCDMPVSLTVLEGKDSVLIGYNQNVALVDFRAGKTVFDAALDGFFFFARVYSSTILVLSELSIDLFSMDGKQLNRRMLHDILGPYHFEEDVLVYRAGAVTERLPLKEFGVF